EEVFGGRKTLAKRLEENRDYGLELFRKDKNVARLLNRAELLVNAEAGRYRELAVAELANAVKKTYRFSTKNLSAFVYLSRLLYAAGSYREMISLTEEMAGLN